MKNLKNKNFILLGMCVMGAFFLTFFFNGGFNYFATSIFGESTAIKQEVEYLTEEPYNVTALYHDGLLIGYFSDPVVLDNLLKQVYNERYKEEFPNSSVSLGLDAYTVLESTYNVYADVDLELTNYINDNQLFTIDAYKIALSNGTTFYVKYIEDYEKAKEEYLLNFIDLENYEKLKNDEETEFTSEYSSRYISMEVIESATISKTYINPGRIFKDQAEIYQFLGYGYNSSFEQYIIQEYDTVAGVASKANISVNNLLAINTDVLKSADQVLSEGDSLNIAKYDSPIQVVVETVSVEAETIYAGAAEIVYDDAYDAGYQKVIREGKNGLKKVTYEITYVNGEVYNTVQVDSVVVEEAQTRKVVVGSYYYVDGSGGDGMFIWPATGNRFISCGYLCYGGHRAIDIQPNGSNSWNYPILAAADGVVTQAMFGSGYGWHVRIRHSNGWETVYAHMIRKPVVSAGQTVTQGQLIGNIGNTGYSFGAHVHFEVRIDNVAQNPCTYLGC
ncbi:MAG: peptidoglycan DD-metalloendopeptidase family protein [Erysipelotrichaceae bacterium]